MSLGEIAAACVGSSGLTGLIVACFQRHWSRQDKKEEKADQRCEKQDAIVNGLKVLTVDRVRCLARSYIKEGSISLEDKETLQDMHRAYKALGGNGHLDTAMAEIERLPISSTD